MILLFIECGKKVCNYEFKERVVILSLLMPKCPCERCCAVRGSCYAEINALDLVINNEIDFMAEKLW